MDSLPYFLVTIACKLVTRDVFINLLSETIWENLPSVKIGGCCYCVLKKCFPCNEWNYNVRTTTVNMKKHSSILPSEVGFLGKVTVYAFKVVWQY
jgi:hypothetical protein